VIQPPGGDNHHRDSQEDEPSDSEAAEPKDPRAAHSEPLDEVREAAGAVIGSLKRLLEATEKVVADPASFDQAVSSGKGLLDAFTSGFANESNRPGAAEGGQHDSSV